MDAASDLTDPGDQATAEQIDEDAIDPTDFPPERPLGAAEFGTTGVEESGGESLAQRFDREDHREDLREEPASMAGIAAPDDEFGEDETPELVGDQVDEPDLLSAEEAAVHEIDEP